MRILVINADCLTFNSSANLCHLAYLNGLVEAGHDVTLLSSGSKGHDIDESMKIPDKVTTITYDGMSLYERLSRKKKESVNVGTGRKDPEIQNNNKKTDIKGQIKKGVRTLKKSVLSLYGIHGIYSTFIRKAYKYHDNQEFDYVLSLSTPVASHLLAYKLIHSKHIKTKNWIQIWEDPWFADSYGSGDNRKVYEEEKRLLSYAWKVCYVSPLTLANQQRIFKDYADKMYWQPLPFYYKNDTGKVLNSDRNIYGYFGDYVPRARDLKPFYEAAVDTGIDVNICGNPSDLFTSTDHIHIYPRLPLNELKPIESAANVLIFLCNRTGGQIPGKIYQYSATYKTILFILDGTQEEKRVLKEFFGKFNRYIFCENNKEDIVRAIKLVEEGKPGTVTNRPLNEFDPVKTIDQILKQGEINV